MSGERNPYYNAEAFALEGYLRRPLEKRINPQAYVSLPEEGGYRSERAQDYHLEAVISFRSAYTQVAGTPSLKPGHGLTTLATAVIEGFNILDVVTADRVVAQIGTDYPEDSYIPSVTFLGSRFDNLRIAGHPVRLDFDANLLGEKPKGDAPYSRDSGFRERVAKQYDQIRKQPNLPAEIGEGYNRLPSNSAPQESIECSLVQHAEGSYPGRTFGHVIDVPHFGKIYLAIVRLLESDPHPKTGIPMKTTISLTMIRTKMGCIADGETNGPTAKTNGTGKGGG